MPSSVISTSMSTAEQITAELTMPVFSPILISCPSLPVKLGGNDEP
jgi:hypothetical protein